jgi:hypothetical protein
VLDRTWNSSDKIELLLDFTLHYRVGERDMRVRSVFIAGHSCSRMIGDST